MIGSTKILYWKGKWGAVLAVTSFLFGLSVDDFGNLTIYFGPIAVTRFSETRG